MATTVTAKIGIRRKCNTTKCAREQHGFTKVEVQYGTFQFPKKRGEGTRQGRGVKVFVDGELRETVPLPHGHSQFKFHERMKALCGTQYWL